MPLTITHSTPADGTFSATGAAAWNANHSFTVTGTSGQLQYNNAGDFAGMSGTSWNDTTRSLTLTGATVTASAPVFDVSQTWNNAAVAFALIRGNATDTASAAGSLLMDLQVGGVSRFAFSKGPTLDISFTGGVGIARIGGGDFQYIDGGNSRKLLLGTNGVGLSLTSDYQIRWSSTTTDAFLSRDLFLGRRAAANLRLGAADAAAPVAQTLSVQSVSSGTTNTAGANFTITGSQGTGTGAGGSIIFQVAPAGSSGTAQNALATALTINGDRSATFEGGIAGLGNITLVGSASNIDITATGTFAPSFRAGRVFIDGSNNGVVSVNSSGHIGISSGNANLTGNDIRLYRDAANTLALRNGTNAQTFNVYNTFTDASNYELLRLVWAGNSAFIQTLNAGTGTARDINLQAASARFFIRNTDLLFFTDNQNDIGAVAATRPRNVYVAGTISPGRGVTVAGLPTPSTGMMARVTDASMPVVGTAVVGGGAAAALVWYNGANWTVIGV